MSTPAPDPELEALTPRGRPVRWGRYELQEVLGQGGVARVFGAELLGPHGFRKPVALKVLRERSAAMDARLTEEARLGARLHHPNIVEVLDLGLLDGRLFIAMERIEGVTARDLVQVHGPLPPRAALAILVGVVAALEHAHSLPVGDRLVQVVHRDVKPTNVLLDRNGSIKLGDFGVASAYGTGAFDVGSAWGTPGYMSPEQAAGKEADGRSDLFSVGVMAVELVLGRRPWRRSELDALVPELADPATALRRWGLEAELEARLAGLARVVAGCLHRDAEGRHPDATALRVALEPLAASAPAGPGLPELVTRAMARRPSGGGLATLTAVHLDPTGSAPRTNLTADGDAFVGRDKDLVRLQRLLSTDRLVTIAGPGGMGKTRLARRLGALALDAFAGGVWFCDLSAARTPDDLLRATSAALGLPPLASAPEALVERIGGRLRDLGAVLLILDNFEQLVEPAAGLLPTWMAAAPAARLLVTSRHRLQLPEEQVHLLRPLLPPEAVALYAARASGHPSGDAPLDDGEVRRLVRRLEGLPLAIELAAAHPPQRLRELGRRLSWEVLDLPPADASRTSLGDALAWSWELLADWERGLATQVAAFEDGFTVAAAEQVVDLSPWPDAPWVLFGLESLLSKSLLHATPGADGPRFRPYRAVHHFLQKRLHDPASVRASDGAPATGRAAMEAVNARHGRCFARLGAESNLDRLGGPEGEQAWDELKREAENLDAALRRALRRRDAAVAAGCALARIETLLVDGPAEPGLELADAALSLGVHERDRVRLAVARARILARLGRREESVTALEVVEPVARRLDDPSLLGRVRELQGVNLWRRGDQEGGRATCVEAVGLFARSGVPWREGLGWLTLGGFAYEQGRLDEATDLFHRALDRFRDTGAVRLEGWAHMNVGLTWLARDGLAEALTELQLALAMQKRTGDAEGAALACGNLALALHAAGRYDEALDRQGEAIAAHRRLGSRRGECAVRGERAEVFLDLGQVEEALAEVEVALRQARSLGWPAGEARLRATLGRATLAAGELDRAAEELGEALALARAQAGEAGALLASLAELHATRGDLERSRAFLDEARSALPAEGTPRGQVRLALAEALLAAVAGQRPLALAAVEDAREACRAFPAGAPPWRWLERTQARVVAAFRHR